LINRYFAKHRAIILKISRNEQDIGECRKVMEDQAEDGYGLKDLAGYKKEIRNAAFRRTVTDAYDYTCAACGLRVILEDLVIVDAAHLIPFSETHDDDPRNGMALCKNHHWAMDSYLIAPGSDNKWHVSGALNARISDQARLVEFSGQKLILPAKKNYHPRADALEWRVSRLRKTA